MIVQILIFLLIIILILSICLIIFNKKYPIKKIGGNRLDNLLSTFAEQIDSALIHQNVNNDQIIY